jgi:serine/threonine protein kinase
MWTKTGTLNYEAPEILSCATYSEKVDIWAVGIMVYELLTGKLPFYSAYSNKTIKMIIACDIDF